MNLLSKYRENEKRLLDEASTGSQMPPRVSIGNNKFTLIDPSGEKTEVPFLPDGAALDVVFVDRNTNMSKLLWNLEGIYNPNEIAPPLCFSDNGVAPSSMSQTPQSLTCATCKHNVIGSTISKISGVPMKLCGDLKKFAVVVRGFPGVYLFTISPGSFKAWNNYINWLRMQKTADGGMPDLADALVRIRFVGQGLLSFEAIEHITDEHEMAQQVIDIWERNKQTDITGMMIGRYDVPAQGALPAPKGDSDGDRLERASQPPPLQGQGLFFQPPARPAPEANKPKRAKKEGPAPIQPPAPVAQHGRQAAPASSLPTDIGARLDSLFKLPPVK